MAVNVEAFYDMINGIAKKQIDASPMDLTIDAKISKLYNVDIGEYKVEYQGNIFSAFVQNPEVTYNVGERVYVLVPQGDFSTKKVILGYSKYDSNLSDADRIDLANQYIIQGPNWYEVGGMNYVPDHEPLQICAVPSTAKKNLKGEAHYQDVGFQREITFSETLTVLDDFILRPEAYTPEHEKTVLNNLVTNTGETEEYFTNLFNSKKWTEALWNAEKQKVIDHLNQYVEDAWTKPVAVPAQLDAVNEVDSRFKYYSQAYDYLMISADFRTEFAMPHYCGRYYLSVMFWYKNPKYLEIDNPNADNAKGQKYAALKEIRLGFDQFNGSPYTFTIDTPQKAFYKINPGELLGIYRVALMQDGNLIADVTPTYDEVTGALQYNAERDNIYDKNNIFCGNIDIRFAKKIDMVENPYYCYIETPQGDSFFEKDENHPRSCTQVDLIPHYIHAGQEITADCEIRWFREDLSVFPSTPTEKDKYGKIWTDYTGAGWRPIEQLDDGTLGYWTLQEDGTLTVYYNNGETIPWKWRFKCVCVYNQQESGAMIFGTATQEVINKNSKYDLYLEKLVSADSSKTKLRINENAPHRVGIDTIPETLNELYPEWYGTWYVELSDGSYLEVDNDTHFLQGPLDVTSWLSYDIVTFRVACYDPQKTQTVGDKLEQTAPVAYLEKTFINNNSGNMLVEWIGRKAFNYTALGKAYPDISSNEYTLQPRLKWNLDPMNYHLVIIAPDGSMLGSRNYYNQYLGDGQDFAAQAGKGYDCGDRSMMTDMYVDSENVVHFKVKAEYESSMSLNTYVCRVLTITDGTWYEAPCEVIFTKDGQSGTQGSGWTAPIRQVDYHEGAGKIAYDPVQDKNIVVAVPAFTTPIGFATSPLVIKKGANGRYVQDDKARRVFIRPFVTKEGRDLMADYGDGRKYKVVITWDVRYPQNATIPQARHSSFLRLHNPRNGVPITMLGTADPRRNDISAGETNPPNTPGMIGQTIWDGEDNTAPTLERNKEYGAVEVRFFDNDYAAKNGELTPGDIDQEFIKNIDMMAGMGWCFVVKATINIYSNDPADFPKTSSNNKYTDMLNQGFSAQPQGALVNIPDEVRDETKLTTFQTVMSPNTRKVKTITSYYPVDLFIKDDIDGDQNKFDPLVVGEMNWPIEIQYDQQGGNPTVEDNFLSFEYGIDDKKIFVKPYSLVQSLATIDEKVVDKGMADITARTWDGDTEITIPGDNRFSDYQGTLEKEPTSQYKYRPVPALGQETGIVGTLYGRIIYAAPDGSYVTKGRYYRNQVFMVNLFSNAALNNWDGHSITLDDENGVILAPQILAGFKGDTSNLFYGVIMGKNTSFPRVQLDANGNRTDQNGIDQLAMVGATLDESLEENAMTGIFGFQQGQPSFGLLENGTAFFGRQDRGGRIIIDGYNATIYGGANGVSTSPKIGDPMWNAMRLTMVDLSHATNGNTAQMYDKDGVPTAFTDERDLYKEFKESGDDHPTYEPELKNGEGIGVGNLAKDAGEAVTTGIRGYTQGFGAGFFGGPDEVIGDDPYGTKRQLPKWYKMVWVGAYIKPQGKLPYWYVKGSDVGTEQGKIRKELWAEWDTETNSYTPIRPNSDGSYDDNVRKDYFIPNPDIVPQLETLAKNHQNGIQSIQGIAKKDASEISTEALQQGLPDFLRGVQYKYGQDNFGVNYWNPSMSQMRAYMDLDEENGSPISGFGPSRASTTPAIEIGQHPTGLMPGLIPLDYDLENIFKEIYIPGDRNFMVTYDGTMWAMNGVFLGNIIGSNIIGGRINGSQIGIGDVLSKADWDETYWPEDYGDWSTLWAPSLTRGTDGAGASAIRESFVKSSQINPNGDALFRKLFLIGGEVHLGTFHILGKTEWDETYRPGEGTSPFWGADHEGHLIQFGVSDFIGPTHFYGSIGIGPNKRSQTVSGVVGEQPWDNSKGNLFQTGGLTALGIILPPVSEDKNAGYNYTFHKKVSEVMYKKDSNTQIWYMNKDAVIKEKGSDSLYYVASNYDYGNPNIQSSKNGLSLEQMSMFAIYTKDAPFIKSVSGGYTPPPQKPTIDISKVNECRAALVAYYNSFQMIIAETAAGKHQMNYPAQIAHQKYEPDVNLYIWQLQDLGIFISASAWDFLFNHNNAYTLTLLEIDMALKKYDTTQSKPAVPSVTDTESTGYVGHFWPMAFRYLPVKTTGESKDKPYDDFVHSYLTTMNIFAAKNTPIGNASGQSAVSDAGGANYFRAGPWGQEGMRYYFTSGWQDENASEQPSVDRLNWEAQKDGVFKKVADSELQAIGDGHYKSPRGFIGVGTGGGGSMDGPPVMFQTWGKSKMFLMSDNEIHLDAVRGTNWWMGGMETKKRDENKGGYKNVGFAQIHRMNFVSVPYRKTEDPKSDGITALAVCSNSFEGKWATYLQNAGTTRKQGEIDENRHMLSLGAVLCAGFGQSNVSEQVGLTSKNHMGQKSGYTVGGVTFDPQDMMEFSPNQKYNGGHGGNYLYGKRDAGIHIIQTKEGGDPKEDGTMTELFLFHEQASLVGEKVILIGTTPKNFDNVNTGKLKDAEIKNVFEEGQGISHAPDTKSKGAGIAIVDNNIQINAGNYLGVDIGMGLVDDKNMGHIEFESTAGFGIDKKNMGIYHEGFISICKGKMNEQYKNKNVPMIAVGADQALTKGANVVFIGDGKGGMLGKNGTVKMIDSWAVPDNQFCIYARFG